ncbi:MAG: recombinase family protein [Candidatus Shapirobacteria bacterium]
MAEFNIVSENAVVAIRVSSIKQGLQGDSPEAQKEQIEQFAKTRNITIKKFFIFMESASKEEQPVQEAIDYCKNPNNGIQLFIIKSIDRFTRGGSYLYDHLKMQLTKENVKLVDIYGIIGSQKVNTLEHLGFEYNWSVYSPTNKAEILEAERAKDEMRDIMSRMIGAEIRYVKLGFRVRRPPFGYINEKVETSHGKRVVLKPHPEESQWILKMYDLRLRGTMTDAQIIDELNKLGYQSRKQYIRNPKDRTKIIGERGGGQLNLKQFLRYMENPIYAGINIEKWTNGLPVKAKFNGIVTVKLFNKANNDKVKIVEHNGELKMIKRLPPEYLLRKQSKSPRFPYKQFILCPHCRKPLYGSASRGKLGKHYPAYHCYRDKHYFRVVSSELENTVKSFVKNLDINKEYVEELKKYVIDIWNKRQTEVVTDNAKIEDKVAELRIQARATADKIKFLNSEVAIKYLEEDLVGIEKQIINLQQGKDVEPQINQNMEVIMENVGYFLEHLEELMVGSKNPLKQAAYFGLIFEQTPTYQELLFGTPKLQPYLTLKDHFQNLPLPIGDPTGN